MLDKITTRVIRSPLKFLSRYCIKQKISATKVTLAGLFLCPFIVTFITFELYAFALLCIVLNRICDGLDGEIARLSHTHSVAGGYLDVMVDYVFYISVPLGFYFVSPAQNGLASIIILASFTLSATQFLGASTSFTKIQHHATGYPEKSIFYPVNFIEGTETIAYTLLVCIFPSAYPTISYILSFLIIVTLPFLVYIRWNYFFKKQHSIVPTNTTNTTKDSVHPTSK